MYHHALIFVTNISMKKFPVPKINFVFMTDLVTCGKGIYFAFFKVMALQLLRLFDTEKKSGQ